MAVILNASMGAANVRGEIEATSSHSLTASHTSEMGSSNISGRKVDFPVIAASEIGTVPVAAYSLKKYVSTYSGYAVKIRRSSDSTTQDIGFLADGSFDESAFTTFIGGGNGFVDTWYDQAGAYDLTQGTAADQPQLVKTSEHYMLKFSGGDFVTNASFIGVQTNSTLSMVWKCPVTRPSGYTTYQSGGLLASDNKFIAPWWTTQQGPSYNGQDSSFYWCDGQPRLHTFTFANGTQRTYEYGAQSRITNTVANPNWSLLTLGKTHVSNGDVYIAECVVWDSIITAQSIYEAYKLNYPSFLPTSSDTVFVNIGDSNSTTTYTNLGLAWPSIAHSDNGSTWWYGQVQGGNTINNWNTDQAYINWYAENLKHSKMVAVIFLGTNDLFSDGLTGAQAFTRLETFVQNLKFGGFTKVVIVTLLPRLISNGAPGIAFEVKRQVFNDAVIANANGYFDHVVDIETACANIGTNGDQDSTTRYLNDYTHLNATGSDELGTAIGIALGSV